MQYVGFVPGAKELVGTVEYLGDGVYAEFEGFAINLYASDGVNRTNEIMIEPDVFIALMKFAGKIWDLK